MYIFATYYASFFNLIKRRDLLLKQFSIYRLYWTMFFVTASLCFVSILLSLPSFLVVFLILRRKKLWTLFNLNFAYIFSVLGEAKIGTLSKTLK